MADSSAATRFFVLYIVFIYFLIFGIPVLITICITVFVVRIGKKYRRDVREGRFEGTFTEWMRNRRRPRGTPTQQTRQLPTQTVRLSPAQRITGLPVGVEPFTILANPMRPGNEDLIPLYATSGTYMIGVESEAVLKRTSYQTNLPLLVPGHSSVHQLMFYFELDLLKVAPDTSLAIGLAPKPYDAHYFPGALNNSVGFWTGDQGVWCNGEKLGWVTWPSKEPLRTIGLCFEYSPPAVRFTINGRTDDSWYFPVGQLSTSMDLWPTIGSDKAGVQCRLIWDGHHTRWAGPDQGLRGLDTGYRYLSGTDAPPTNSEL